MDGALEDRWCTWGWMVHLGTDGALGGTDGALGDRRCIWEWIVHLEEDSTLGDGQCTWEWTVLLGTDNAGPVWALLPPGPPPAPSYES